MVRIDLNEGSANIMITDEEVAERFKQLEADGGYPIPENQTPWQEIFRDRVEQFDQGMIMRGADKYQKIHVTKGIPRDNH
jgi:dihydroxy-acid dehydratase